MVSKRSSHHDVDVGPQQDGTVYTVRIFCDHELTAFNRSIHVGLTRTENTNIVVAALLSCRTEAPTLHVHLIVANRIVIGSCTLEGETFPIRRELTVSRCIAEEETWSEVLLK